MKTELRPFKLEEFVSNAETPVVTELGLDFRIICTDRKGGGTPVVGLVNLKFGDEYVEMPLTFDHYRLFFKN